MEKVIYLSLRLYFENGKRGYWGQVSPLRKEL